MHRTLAAVVVLLLTPGAVSASAQEPSERIAESTAAAGREAEIDDGLFRRFTVPGERLLPLLEGRRPEIRHDFDVHLVDGALIYVREACDLADVAAAFFLHVRAVDPDDLPVPRRQHGFDNLDFGFDERGGWFGGACLAAAPLPEYDVAAIRTGQYVAAEGGARETWSGEIRFGPDRADRVEIAMPADPPIGNAVANRIEFLDDGPLHEPVLWYGGRFQFMDLCPEWGCLAVQFGTDGAVEQAWPLRPHALEQAANDYPHIASRWPAPRFSFVRDAAPVGIARYPNGDLLVVLYSTGRSRSFPQGAGAVRIDRRGYPVWFRRDLSHHWPHRENDGSFLVLARSYGDEPLSVPLDDGGSTLALPCREPRLEYLNRIDGDGRLLDRIDLMGALLDSPFFAPALIENVDLNRCNLVHTNFVHRIGDDAQDARGLSSGDLVISMRNLSAFAILDAESGRVKRLVRGSFRLQHSVHHWRGSRFLLFDNNGAGEHRPSRLLMVDLADGRETTIFPNPGTPEELRHLYSYAMGKISLSPDRRRALVSFAFAGVAVEVRLSDGAALKVFRSLHDVSGLEQFPEERATRPAVFTITGLDYVHRRPPAAAVTARE